MDVRVDLTKSLQENAESYFQDAKKARRKLKGATAAREEFALKAEKLALERAAQQEKAALEPYPTRWYHKYRWSFTRNGLLLVGGQNASANEAIVKTHTEKDDVLFHTDMAGSPFVVLKGGQQASEEDLADAGQMTAAWSRGWDKGLGTVDVFWVLPEQVTKEAQSGEFLGKGAFMIRGKTNYVHPAMEVCATAIIREGVRPEVFIGTKEACLAQNEQFTRLVPGETKKSDIAKQLARRFGADSNDYIKQLPTGGSRVAK